MENPFSCELPNCTMSFESEDQLMAHKKKHELSLTLTPSLFKNPFILDQSPTPTQFLNPVSLELEDLRNDNPFDATFRKANSSSHASNLVIPESSSFIASLPDSDVLNTPSIILPSEPATTPISLKPNFMKKLIIKRPDNQCDTNGDSLPFSPNENTNVQSDSPTQSTEDAELPSESASFSNVVSSQSVDSLSDSEEKDKKNGSTKNVLQTSVITSVGNTAILKGNAVGVPTAVVVTRAPISGITAVSSSQVSVVGQQTNRVKIQKSVPAVIQPLPLGAVLLSINLGEGTQILLPPGNNLSTTAQPIAPQVTSTTPNAKMKLKEVLTQNQKSGSSSRKSNSPKFRPRSSVHMNADSSDGARMSSSPPSSPIQSLKPGHIGRKRRDTIDDPEEKRKRSLERNRAAATRCREKRKMWITNLEKKADELAVTNVQLQHEVNQLRNEVAHLKTLLLQHKDCPVTLQQKASVHETERETYTTVRIFTSSSDDVQQVPNVSVISPSSSDFMEIEVSSVQSNSDSLTSDTSEASYRER